MVKIIRYGICVMNDSVNSFDKVIETFIDTFNWDVTQAANCAYIIHRKGEYVVKWSDSEEVARYTIGLLRLKGLKTKLILTKDELDQ